MFSAYYILVKFTVLVQSSCGNSCQQYERKALSSTHDKNYDIFLNRFFIRQVQQAPSIQ